MEKRLQMMERKISSGPARLDELAQRLSIVADKATEVCTNHSFDPDSPFILPSKLVPLD